jgi:Tfp pilus assembly protein PilX
MRTQSRSRSKRRGATAVLAMLFLVLFATLSTAMYSMSSLNVQGADNLADNDRARASAESGLRWAAWRFIKMARPKTTIGTITPAVATTLWPTLRTSIANDFATNLTTAERTLIWDGITLSSTPISTGTTEGKFIVQYRLHPIGSGDALDQRYIRVTSIGSYGSTTKSVSMDFKMDKKVKFAIVGKVPIQIGRNTLVEGPIATTVPNFAKGPPIYMLSDFHHLTPALGAKIDAFNTFLAANHNGYDNRISVNNPDEAGKAVAAGYTDYNGDGFIDEYDLFLKEFDKDGDKKITKSEFTDPSTGKLYDPDLFTAIDSLGAPMFAGDTTRAGYQDGVIDNKDAYTKVRGQISMAVTANAWTTNLAASGLTIQNEVVGPIQSDNGALDPAVKFGITASDVFDLSPSDFDTSSFKNKTGPANGATTTGAVAGQYTITNKVLSASDAASGATTVQVATAGTTGFTAGQVVLQSDFNAANATRTGSNKATTSLPVNTATEQTPYGSTSWQATYKRPVFKNMHFVNVQIPKGLNALFDNCTFDGVTYVDLTTNITNSSGQTTTSATDGMTYSEKMLSGSFSNTTVLTTTNSSGFNQGNNLRFNNCTMQGPLASDVPTAYTAFGNSWEFTGATTFNNLVDQTATMVCPQTNIEMGSFTDPSKAPSTLIGVVVTGNIDIRGSSVVDGSIIVTGDGAGNTTQGWFGPSDSNTDPNTPMPQGGWGHLNIRYNPNRAMPDGINVAIDVLGDADTYMEGQ